MYEEGEVESLAPWLAIVIALIGGGLRVLLLDQKGMWLDETFSLWLAHHSVADMLRWIARIDQQPPLYYLLLHYWTALQGDAPYYARLLSVLFGTATIPVVYLIGKRMSGVVTGLAAALILALSPFNIRFAQETRMYTLLAFNAAVAIYALVRLLTDARSARPIGSQFREYLHAWRTSAPAEPGAGGAFSYKSEARDRTGWRSRIVRHRWLPIRTIETDLAWVALVLFSAATMLSHNTAVLFPVATNVFVLGLMLVRRLRESGSPPAFQAPSLRNWVKAQMGILLLWSPWLPVFVRQVGGVFQEFWIPKPGWDTVVHALESLLSAPMPGQGGQMLVLWILCAMLLCLGLVHYRKGVSRFLFLAALIAIPFLGELLVSIGRPVFLDRTLIWTSIPLFLMLAAGIGQLRFRVLMVVVVGILATYNLFSAGDYYRFVQKEDWSTAAGFVANFAQKDDLVLFNAPSVQIPFDYYFKKYEDQYSLQVEKSGLPVDMFDSGVVEPKMTADDTPSLLSLIRGRKRVWLVYSHNSCADPMGLIPQTLASEMQLLRRRDFYGGQVQLYGAP